MDLTLNGEPVSVDVRPRMSLLELLREELGVTSVKDGCAPEGSCGACTGLIDGKAGVSCAQKAVAALVQRAGPGGGEPVPVPERSGRVGTRAARYQGRELALGDKPYVNDLRPDGLLHGALRFSDHPRATVLAIDISKAQAHPGIVAVLRAGDVPGERVQGLITRDWRQLVAVVETTSYVGDVLAIVVAESRHARYGTGALNGVVMRMALLALVLGAVE